PSGMENGCSSNSVRFRRSEVMAPTSIFLAASLVFAPAPSPSPVDEEAEQTGDGSYQSWVGAGEDPTMNVASTLEEQQAAIDGSGGGDSDVTYFRATVHQ